MKIRLTQFGTLLFALAFTFTALFTSCSKDDDNGEDIIDPVEEFSKLGYAEQHSLLTNMLKTYAGSEYRLISVVYYTKDGGVEQSYVSSDCELKVIVSLPNEVNTGQAIKQIIDDGGCGVNYDSEKYDLFDFGFSNVKYGLRFYTVINHNDPSKYSTPMFYLPKDGETSDYLTLYTFHPEDLESATNNYGKVAGRVYQKFSFERLK